MSDNSTIAALQGLLARVRRNAAAPRAPAPAAPTPAVATPAVATPAVATPAVAAPAFAPRAPTFAAPTPAFVPPAPALTPPAPTPAFVPPAPAYAPPAPAPALVAPPASAGDDVDDLLGEPLEAREDLPRSQVVTPLTDDVEDIDMDDDLVEIEADGEAPAVEISTDSGELDVDIDFDEEEGEVDEPPASSRRPIEGASLDEALASAAEADAEADREPPLHTPPPESGQQVAAPAIPSTAATPDFAEFDLGAARDKEAGRRVPMITMEQLGETVELEGADAPDAQLELDAPPEPEARVPDELEVAIPSGPPAAIYDAALALPPEAKDELERHKAIERERSGTPPPVVQQAPTVAEAAPESARQAITRPAAAGAPADFMVATSPTQPKTFLELLDKSLSLVIRG